MSELRAVVAAVGALAIGFLGLYELRVTMASAEFLLHWDSGLGAMSIGISEVLVEFFPGVVVNRVLSAWARRSGGAIRMLHRVQSWTLILMFVAAAIVWLVRQLFVSTLAGWPIYGLLFGGQMMLAAALLGTYALRTSRNL